MRSEGESSAGNGDLYNNALTNVVEAVRGYSIRLD